MVRQSLGIALSLVLLGVGGASAGESDFERYRLTNEALEFELTPSLGGRVTRFATPGGPNLIKLGQPLLAGVQPELSPFADNIGYLGSIVWLAPQSEWWSKQQLNPARAKAIANWPPDPYLIFGENQLVKQSDTELVLQGLASPLSGVRVDKSFELGERLRQTVTLTNVSEQPQQWGLWFNTRIEADATLFIPVRDSDQIKHAIYSERGASLVQHLGVQVLNPASVASGALEKGKLFIQPDQGWMAAARDGQLFVIEFSKVQAEQIHPEHGQIEIYYHLEPSAPEASLIEMEFHAPYQTLAPAQQTATTCYWSIWNYPKQLSANELVELLQQKLSFRN